MKEYRSIKEMRNRKEIVRWCVKPKYNNIVNINGVFTKI